jgi:Carbohydrate-selective porin, OprB family
MFTKIMINFLDSFLTKKFYSWLLFSLNFLLLSNISLVYAQESSLESQDFIENNYLESEAKVTDLSDISAQDWAYQAVISLHERYHCLSVHDGKYKGNQVLTRVEFAQMLNSCLQKISTVSDVNFIKKDDLVIIQKLSSDFNAELTALSTKIDDLESRSTQLESSNFAPTTKLNMEVITFLGGAFGKNATALNRSTFSYSAGIQLTTSFTGKDSLRTRLFTNNFNRFDGGEFDRNPDDISDETRFSASDSNNNQLELEQIEYKFPIGDNINIYLEAATIDPTYITDPLNAYFLEPSTGALSNFAPADPVFFAVSNQAGFGANIILAEGVNLDLGYFGEAEGASNPDLGFFQGGYSILSHLVVNKEQWKLGFLYTNSYSPLSGVNTYTGSKNARILGAGPVVANNYSLHGSYRFNSHFELGGWFGYTQARSLTIKGDADIINFAVTLAFPDLLKKGNLGGVIIGMHPKLISTSNENLASAIGLPEGERSDRATGLHIEVLYRHQLTDNISITPGFFWLTAPNHDDRNPDVFIGLIRTSFVF